MYVYLGTRTGSDVVPQDEYSLLNSKHVSLLLISLPVDTDNVEFIGLHGYMLVYSVASQQSFEMVTIIRDKILNHLVRINSPNRPTASY